MAVTAPELTEQDREKITTSLSRPLHFPPEFKKWLLDYLAMNIPPIPVEHFLGYVKTKAFSSVVITGEGTDSTAYTDLTTVGPEITGLGDGLYVLLYGVTLSAAGSPGQNRGQAAPSINAATPADLESVDIMVANTTNMVGCFAVVKEISGGSNNNSVKLQYKKVSGETSGQPLFHYRWLVALRVS